MPGRESRAGPCADRPAEAAAGQGERPVSPLARTALKNSVEKCYIDAVEGLPGAKIRLDSRLSMLYVYSRQIS